MRGMSLADTALVGQGGFNPLNDIPWLHAVWLNDPLWTPPGSGQPISSLRNVSGGGDPAATLTARPVQLGTTLKYAQFDGSNDALTVDIADIAQPFKVMVVGAYLGMLVSRNLVGFGSATAASGIGINASALWYLNAGTGLQSAVAATASVSHVIRATVNGASSQLWMDETSIMGPGNAGAGAMDQWSLGSGIVTGGTTSRFAQCAIGFCGICSASVSDADLSALAAKLKYYYGTP